MNSDEWVGKLSKCSPIEERKPTISWSFNPKIFYGVIRNLLDWRLMYKSMTQTEWFFQLYVFEQKVIRFQIRFSNTGFVEFRIIGNHWFKIFFLPRITASSTGFVVIHSWNFLYLWLKSKCRIGIDFINIQFNWVVFNGIMCCGSICTQWLVRFYIIYGSWALCRGYKW